MIKTSVERKKIRKAEKPRRVAGVQVRSGVKAGKRGLETEIGRGGLSTDIPGRLG